MTKAELILDISRDTGIDRQTVSVVIEAFMKSVKGALSEEENVYLRGFGSFILKQRAPKTARNISKNVALVIPKHNVPVFKPSIDFKSLIKNLSDKNITNH